jgi:UDP:flavonoid glycosyltransferase YjiC (YdhE family)
VVCHGGSGTLLAALALGIPVVVLPMGADQPDNGDRCTALGCGVVLDATVATTDEIADAVDLVAHDDRFRRSAERLAAEARSQPSLEQITELRALLGLDDANSA